MSVRSASEATCDFCVQLLGPVSVETVGGEKLHPDCYDKWRAEELAKRAADGTPATWSAQRGVA